MSAETSTAKQDILYKISERDYNRKLKIDARREQKTQDLNANKTHLFDQLKDEIDLITTPENLSTAERKFSEISSNFSTGECHLLNEKLAGYKGLFAIAEEERAKRNHTKFYFKKKRRLIELGYGPDSVQTGNTITDPKSRQKAKNILNKNQKIITSPGTFNLINEDALDVLIRDVHGPNAENKSEIHLTKKCSTLHIEDCSNISVTCKTDTSFFIENVQNSNISVQCQQLRMHRCNYVGVEIECFSRSIIEESKNIVFKRLNENTKVENFSNVDDFDWLSKEEKSPNFSVVM